MVMRAAFGNDGVDVQGLRHDIYALMGWHYRAKSLLPAPLPLMHATGMLPSQSGHFNCNGHITGQAFKGTGFSILELQARTDVEAGLKDGIINDLRSPEPFPGFHGVIISFDHHDRFYGRTAIVRDRGFLNREKVNEMSRVGMASLEFERWFEVYSDDQVEGRALITPDFMERIMIFQDDIMALNVECLFIAQRCHILLFTEDRFSFGHDFPAEHTDRAARRIVSEIGSVCNLMERVQYVHACLGRGGITDDDGPRHDYFAKLMTDLEVEVEARVKDGTFSKMTNPRNKHLTEHAHLVCPSLRGLLYPRF